MDSSQTERAVRRNTALLMTAEPMNRAILTLAFTVGVVAIVDFAGRDLWAGIFIAVDFGLTAVGAFLAGRAMDRWGRRPGLMAGYVLMIAGSAVAWASVGSRSVLGLMIAGAVIGFASGACNLGRAAAADMYPPERRGTAVGFVLAVGTVGAVGGPLLAGLLARFAPQGHDASTSWLPWAATGVLGAIGLAAVAGLRPDPKALAVAPASGAPAGERRTLPVLMGLAPFRAAVVAIGVAQASMVAVMGVTPVHIHARGGTELAVGATVSLHVAGMFAFSPLVGAALDRWGRRPGLLFGAVVCAGGALVTAVAPDSTAVVAAGLFLVGLGWSGVFLASTAVISDVTTAQERAGSLGFVDLIAALAAAVGALAGGFVLEAIGFATVGASVAALLVPVLVLVVPLREPSPGRWAPAAAGP